VLQPLLTLETFSICFVCDQAVKAAEKVILAMPEEHLLVKYFAPFVINLATKDWCATLLSSIQLLLIM
jgi:hypothetical protein